VCLQGVILSACLCKHLHDYHYYCVKLLQPDRLPDRYVAHKQEIAIGKFIRSPSGNVLGTTYQNLYYTV